MPTNIEWTDESWNPITGCTPISEGCAHCYARSMAKRLAGRYGYPDAPNEFDVTLHPDKLNQPLHWKKPRMIFICSMGDLFHDDVEYEWIFKIFAVMSLCQQHTFQILTKRPENMKRWFNHYSVGGFTTREIVKSRANKIQGLPHTPAGWQSMPWPLPNVWIGVTTENQETAEERIPWLTRTPAAVHFVSAEPMLEAIDYSNHQPFIQKFGGFRAAKGILSGAVDWVICGFETGPGAREGNPDHARDLRDQCAAAGVPFFFKRMTKGPIPEDLQIRQWPKSFVVASEAKQSQNDNRT